MLVPLYNKLFIWLFFLVLFISLLPLPMLLIYWSGLEFLALVLLFPPEGNLLLCFVGQVSWWRILDFCLSENLRISPLFFFSFIFEGQFCRICYSCVTFFFFFYLVLSTSPHLLTYLFLLRSQLFIFLKLTCDFSTWNWYFFESQICKILMLIKSLTMVFYRFLILILNINIMYLSLQWFLIIKSAKTRPGEDCGSDHALLIAKFRLKLKKVGKTTKPSRYDINQIPYDYTVEVRNSFNGLDLIDKVSDELWTEVCDIVQETWIKTIPK